MLQQLLLLRHAKAEPQGHHFQDHERPLHKRGTNDCVHVASYLKTNQLIPDFILSSDSVRTEQTREHVCTGLGTSIPFEASASLYLANPTQILKTIASVPDHVTCLMVIAHNPGLQQLAMLLAQAYPDFLAAIRSNFPTSAMAGFHVHHTQWHSLAPIDVTPMFFKCV